MSTDAAPQRGAAIADSDAVRPDYLAMALALAVALVLYTPAVLLLSKTTWSSVESSYGPVLLAAAGWLLWQRLDDLAALPPPTNPMLGYVSLGFGLLVYAVGKSQNVLFVEVGSAVLVAGSIAFLCCGWAGLRRVILPLVLLLLVVPLPSSIVATLTGPLKAAVSVVSAEILGAVGYPVARTGVILMVGPYQLLVADACAGLTSMFTLEAIGLVYMGLKKYPSWGRNLTLGLLLVPIAFVANVIRVLILVLVTYHFGDEAGQGFIHSAASIVLFMVATLLMLMVDSLLSLYPWKSSDTRAPA